MDRRIKLFVVIYSLARGGAERVAVQMAGAWAQQGVEVTLVTLDSSDTDFFAVPAGVERIALGQTSDHASLVRRVRVACQRLVKLRRLLRERRPDAAVGFMVAAAVALAIGGFGLPGRRIGSERTYPPMMPLGVVGETIRRFAYGLLYSVVGQTRDCADWLKASTLARRVRTIPNSVIMPLPGHSPRVVVTDHVHEHEKVLLAVGRFGPEKQFEGLVRAFASIADRHPEWRLVIAGGGELHLAVTRLAESLGVAERVIVPGPVGNIAEWYQRASAYVLTSRFEGFPNSLLEAMAYGLPVVAFDCKTGPSDMIDHGANGLLIAPQDFDGLATTLDRLLADESDRQRLGKAATAVRARFAESAVMKLWAEEMGGSFLRALNTSAGHEDAAGSRLAGHLVAPAARRESKNSVEV